LLRLLAASDFGRIRIAAHNLKGTGSAYGFETLTEIGAGMERSAREPNAATLREQIATLGEYLERVELEPGG
jgi:HPt (histidine-containing phosphotransfer) domain-containing protein